MATTNDEIEKIHRSIDDINRWSIETERRIRIMESVLSDTNIKSLNDSITGLERIVMGDSELGAPPLRVTIESMEDMHNKIGRVLAGMIVAQGITLMGLTAVVLFVLVAT